jgi:hypothetical protein
MADPTLGEAATGGVLAFLAGIGATFKAMRGRNGNGRSREEYHELDKRVSLVERDISGIRDALDDIKTDISEIMAAVRRND